MTDITFAHISDPHIGYHSQDPKSVEIQQNAFGLITDEWIRNKVKFVVISGDLFDSHTIDLSIVDNVVNRMKKVRDANIPIYVIHGSHDYCSGGKSIFDVLCSTGLIKNIFNYDIIDNKLRLKFTTDENTGVKLVGIPGEIGSLESKYYDRLDKEYIEKEVKNEKNVKIFAFHHAITGLVHMRGRGRGEDDTKIDINRLPKGFDYYAGGHSHDRLENNPFLEDYRCVVYPGIPFVVDPKDISNDMKRGFYIVRVDDKGVRPSPIDIDPCQYIIYECDQNDKTSIDRLLNNISRCSSDKNTLVKIKIDGKYIENKTPVLKQLIRNKFKDKGITNIFIDSPNAPVIRRKDNITDKDHDNIDVNKDMSIEDVFKKHIKKTDTYNFDNVNLKGDLGIRCAVELLRHIGIPMGIDDVEVHYNKYMVNVGIKVLEEDDKL